MTEAYHIHGSWFRIHATGVRILAKAFRKVPSEWECPHGIYGSDKQGLDMTGPGEVSSMLVVHIMISIIKWRWKASCGPTAHTRQGIVSVRRVCDEAAQNKAVKAW